MNKFIYSLYSGEANITIIGIYIMNKIIGTAGHVDHGKSELIKALTGISMMRLTEEHKR